MRTSELAALLKRRRLDMILVHDQANIRALTGVNCDNAILQLIRKSPSSISTSTSISLYTDFRYIPMVHRVAPDLRCRDIRRFSFVTSKEARKAGGARIGIEYSLSHDRYLELEKAAPRGAKLVDIADDLLKLRAVKTPDEIGKIRAAEALACEIFNEASAFFRPGMTERQMANVIRKMMIDQGDGEAFATIVCVGKNAAECHHEPDETVWDGREPILVDMGVKLAGYCSDLTRNILPKRRSATYRRVYDLVLKANRAAIAAARPGMTGRKLDGIARDIIRKGGFGKCFGHSLGHGVGLEIHESPYASRKSKTVLKPGMLVTIEPGIYLEDNLGVRIEDLVLITEDGCEVLSAACGK